MGIIVGKGFASHVAFAFRMCVLQHNDPTHCSFITQYAVMAFTFASALCVRMHIFKTHHCFNNACLYVLILIRHLLFRTHTSTNASVAPSLYHG